MKVKSIVFDAYGTLFDVHSVVQACEREFPGQGAALSREWRAKQLEYTWLRSLMARYEDFSRVTASALEFACAASGLSLTAEAKGRLMEEYVHLALFPEVRDALTALSSHKLGILSNGSPSMLETLVENSGLKGTFALILSADYVKCYKPSPAVYQLAPTRLKTERAAIGFVSSNYWDISGAASFGFQTFWINRTGAVPDVLGFSPTATLTSLAELKPE